MRRGLRTGAGVVLLAATMPVLAVPTLVCLDMLERFGPVSLLVIVPVLAVWVMIVMPVLAFAAKLIAPTIATEGFARTHRSPAPNVSQSLAYAFERREDELERDAMSGGPGRTPRFTDLYGLRSAALLAVAVVAVFATAAIAVVAR